MALGKWGIFVIDPDGTSFQKTLEETIYDADSIGKKFVTKAAGKDRIDCFLKASQRGKRVEFLKTVNMYRITEPQSRYDDTLVEFYD